MKIRSLLFLMMIFGMVMPPVSAEEVGAPPVAVREAPAPKRNTRSKNKKGSAPREKETEGTEALDRFEADTVIKSQYHLDGKQLEVDPD